MALTTNAMAKEIANDLIEISGRHADGGVGSTIIEPNCTTIFV
jgi:hypothetical protein